MPRLPTSSARPACRRAHRAAGLLLLGLLLGIPLGSCSRPAPLDILLVSLDSVRRDALEFTDAEAAPRLAGLASSGVAFDQAISGSSWTLPAHAQMFTGLPPVLHGVQLDDLAIDPLTPTLPELLQAGGWFTAGLWTGWYLAGDFGFERGFHAYENRMSGGEELERMFRLALDAGDIAMARGLAAARDTGSHQDITSERVVERARVLVDHAPREDGLFLFAHFFDPHYDYIPPEPWDTRFDEDYAGDMDGRDYYTNTQVYDSSARPPRRVSDRDLAHLVALYRGEIAWVDRAVGQLVDLLEERRGLERTLVIVTADHGEEFFEHGGRGHRNSLYDELLRVPLLLVPPSGRSSDALPRVATQVSLSDLLPTALDYAGLEVPSTVRGRSLRPALSGGTLAPRAEVATLTLFNLSGPGGAGVEWLVLDCLRTPQRKLIRTLGVRPGEPPRLRRLEYYDLVLDPGEKRPRSSPTDPEVARSWAELEGELDGLRAAWRAMPRSAPSERSTRVRELFAPDLEALGYAGGEIDALEVSPGLGMPWPPGPHPPVELGTALQEPSEGAPGPR